MSVEQRLETAKYEKQGEYKKVLFLCSAGCLRSATAAHLFAGEPYNWNTRCAGVVPEYAITIVDEVLLEWADEIFFMDQVVFDRLGYWMNFPNELKHTILDIPDVFDYRSPALIETLKEQVGKALGEQYGR